MPRYIATIQHHSIRSARSITVDGSLRRAKQAATREFGDENRDYVILILENYGHLGRLSTVASRRIRERLWLDH